MKCRFCNEIIPDGSRFCHKCGREQIQKTKEELIKQYLDDFREPTSAKKADEVNLREDQPLSDDKQKKEISEEPSKTSTEELKADRVAVANEEQGDIPFKEKGIGKPVFRVPQNKEIFYQPGENACATCVSVNDGIYHFYCIDNLSHFYWNQKVVDNIDEEIEVGNKVWVNLKELKDEKRYLYRALYLDPKTTPVGKEFNLFCKYHNVGDILYAPIVEAESSFFCVRIGSKAQVKITRDSLPPYIDPSRIKKDSIRRLKVTRIDNENGRIRIELNLYEDQFFLDKKDWAELPKTLKSKEVKIYDKIINLIKEENIAAYTHIFNGKEPSVKNLTDFLNEKYEKAYRAKEINIQHKKKCTYMDFDLEFKNEKGTPQSACFKKNSGDTWFLCLIGFSSAECMFENHVYIPDWRNLLKELKELALGGEDWDYNSYKKDEYYILRQYLLFGYYKSWLDGLITEENGEALFNTGLVDSAYDDIYCYLKKNSCDDDFYERKWEFGGFSCRAKGSLGKKLMKLFTSFPDAPSYINLDKISDMYFNPEKDLFCDYEHIIGDNLKRLPLNFIKSRLCYDGEMDALIKKYETDNNAEILSEIESLVNRDNEKGERFRRDLINGLKDAVETAKKYCKWNYKTAIPIYYPRNNSISLLLPLKLQSGYDSKVDVALVVERLENGNYQGQTILTLAMAYQDARQICRPNSEWLTIDNINNDTGDETDEEDKI